MMFLVQKACMLLRGKPEWSGADAVMLMKKVLLPISGHSGYCASLCFLVLFVDVVSQFAIDRLMCCVLFVCYVVVHVHVPHSSRGVGCARTCM